MKKFHFFVSKVFFDKEIINQFSWFRKYLKIKSPLNNKEDWSLISKTIEEKYKKNKNIFSDLVDAYKNSDEFKNFVFGYKIYDFCKKFLNIKRSNLFISHVNYRLDLTNKYSDNNKKMSLDWHQDFSYFKSKGNCGPRSFVLSIPTHDCLRENGCLLVDETSSKKLYFHKKFFLKKKKHLRRAVRPPKNYLAMETNFGQAQVISFLTKHKSGVNCSNILRSTLLLRVSDKSDKDFKLVSKHE